MATGRTHKKMKVVVACPIAVSREEDRLRSFADIAFAGGTDEENLIKSVGGAEGLIVPWTSNEAVTRRVLDAGSALKIIGTTYGGVGNTAAAEILRRGITLVHTGPSRSLSIAEFTLALILASLMDIPRLHLSMRMNRDWPNYGKTRNLSRRRVGIIGVGLIARDLIKLLKPFECEIYAYSRHLLQTEAEKLGVTGVGLKKLLRECEIICLCQALTRETCQMLGTKELGLIRKDAILVNTARGKLIDCQALTECLKAGKFKAALDVFGTEPEDKDADDYELSLGLSRDSELRGLENVILTPHAACRAVEMDTRRWEFIVEEFRLFQSGKKPRTSVTMGELKWMGRD